MMRVLAVYDRPGWAYWRRVQALVRFAPKDITITPAMSFDLVGLAAVDVVLLLDYVFAKQLRRIIDKLPEAQRPRLVTCFNSDDKRRQTLRKTVCQVSDWVICNNERARQACAVDGFANVCHIANGVELDEFRLERPIDSRPDRVLWLSSVNAVTRKRHALVVESTTAIHGAGFELDCRVIGPESQNRIPNMAAWYNSGSYVLCTASSDATPNYMLEGMACGCVGVSTPVGNLADEAIRWEEYASISEPTTDCIVDALTMARANQQGLAEAGMAYIRRCHDWAIQSRLYYECLRQAGSKVQ